MAYATKHLTEQESAGLNLLGTTLQQESVRIARRWKNHETREYCVSIYRLGEALCRMAKGGDAITIQVLVQEELFDYHLTDEAYSVIE